MKIGSHSWGRLIIDGAIEFGILLDHEKVEKLARYSEELIAWNRKINLTAITDPFEIAVKHIIDSLVPSLYIAPESSVIDIGSGAGFPGIPLAIHLPRVSTTLIDTSRKKVSFLKHIVRLLELPNISVYQMSAEEIGQNRQLDNTYNVIISRALFSLEKLVSMMLPILSEKGAILAMKGKSENEDRHLTKVIDLLDTWKQKSEDRNYTHSIKRYILRPIGAERTLYWFQLNF